MKNNLMDKLDIRLELVQQVANELDDNSHASSIFEMTKKILSKYDLTLKELNYLVVTRPKINMRRTSALVQRRVIMYIINDYGIDNLTFYHSSKNFSDDIIHSQSIFLLNKYLDKEISYKLLNKYLDVFDLSDFRTVSILFDRFPSNILSNNDILKKFIFNSKPNIKVFIFFKLNLKLKKHNEQTLLELFAGSAELDENTQPLDLEKARAGKKVIHISSKYSKLSTLLQYEGLRVKVHG